MLVAGTASAAVEVPYFSAGALVAFRPGSEVASFVGAWTPFVAFDDGYAIRGDLGTSLLKDSLGDLLIGIHGEVYGMFPLAPDALAWEVGGGAVYWSGTNGGFAPVVSTGLAFGIGGTLVDRVTTTYSYHFLGAGVQWFRVSLGLRWSAGGSPAADARPVTAP